MQRPTCLMYNLAGERLRRISLLARRFKIQLVMVQPADYGQPIGTVLGLQERVADAPERPPFDDEMMVMAGFKGPLGASFLNGFRQQGLQPIRLKAMLTETNSQWDAYQLHSELSEEHAYFAKMKKGLHEKQLQEAAENAAAEASRGDASAESDDP